MLPSNRPTFIIPRRVDALTICESLVVITVVEVQEDGTNQFCSYIRYHSQRIPMFNSGEQEECEMVITIF